MTFKVTRKCSVVKNYPELGIMKAGNDELLEVSYTAIIVNSLSNATAEVQFDVQAEGIGNGLITFSFMINGINGLLEQAESALKSKLANQE
ncbi:hypothetical protein V6082_08640 [Klebsiella pneumoniae]